MLLSTVLAGTHGSASLYRHEGRINSSASIHRLHQSSDYVVRAAGTKHTASVASASDASALKRATCPTRDRLADLPSRHHSSPWASSQTELKRIEGPSKRALNDAGDQETLHPQPHLLLTLWVSKAVGTPAPPAVEIEEDRPIPLGSKSVPQRLNRTNLQRSPSADVVTLASVLRVASVLNRYDVLKSCDGLAARSCHKTGRWPRLEISRGPKVTGIQRRLGFEDGQDLGLEMKRLRA